MKIRVSIFSVATIIALSLAAAIPARAEDAFVGIWKLNITESKFSPGSALKSGAAKVEAEENGIRCVLDPVAADGTARHAEWAAKYDGKDYQAGMKPFADTVALNRIDAFNMEALYKRGGKEILSERWVFSAARKTLTMTQKMTNAEGQASTSVLVYDKQ